MRVDVIVPSIDGREASLERTVASYEGHNVIVVRNKPTCGAAWAEGIAQGSGDYVHLTSDDIECLNPGWAKRCMAVCDEGGLPCPRLWRPDGTLESAGGDMGALHHITRQHQKDGTQVDYTTVPFMSREQAERIGVVPELHYCSDVWVSHRGRQLGIETYLLHGYELCHWQEQVGRGAGMPQAERDAHDYEILQRELRSAEG